MFFHQKQELADIFIYYDTSRASLNYYRKNIEENRITEHQYIGCTRQELIRIFQNHLEELEKNVCLSILNAIEADFRTDYLIRVRKKHKSILSIKFRELDKEKVTSQ